MMHNCEQIGRYHSRLRIERMVLRALLANRETMRQDRHASAEDIYMKRYVSFASLLTAA
jgi:hypothetical protein